jgi:hypothetical protein
MPYKISSLPTVPPQNVFLLRSRTFRDQWTRIEKIAQSSLQSGGVSVLDHTLEVFSQFETLGSRLVLNAPLANILKPSTLLTAHKMAKDITDRELMDLVILAHDFGKSDAPGAGHQKEGVKYIQTITHELELPTDTQYFARLLVEHHSLPAELYLGEAPISSWSNLMKCIPDTERQGFARALILLNWCDVASVRNEPPALFDDNARFLLSLFEPKNVQLLHANPEDDRLQRLTRSRFPKGYSDAEQLEIEQFSEQRYRKVKSTIEALQSQIKFETLLRNVNFHYTASLFPKLSSIALYRFLEISAEATNKSNVNRPITELICTDDRTGEQLSLLLEKTKHIPHIANSLIERNGDTIIWNTHKLRDT